MPSPDDTATDRPAPRAASDVGQTAAILAQWRRARPDLDLAGFLIGVQIGRLGLLSQQIAERTADLFEIGPGEMLVVTALRRQGPPYELRPTDLFRLLGVTSGAMTYRIDKLAARGLVERAPDPEDGRGAVVRLTPAGVASADKVVDVAADFWNARLANLAVEPGALARLEASLAELADQMERFEMSPRTLKAMHPAMRDDIGDLVTRRPLPGPRIQLLDPFLFLNHHGPQTYPAPNNGLPFGPHPHRGFETVTFILEGELAHLDSGGHESIITAGGVQWMTAGRGLVHAELSPAGFKQRGGPLEILQLWVNLPARLKMVEPRYIGLQREEIPALVSDGGRATINPISGDWADGAAGPIASLTDVQMATVFLEPGGRIALPAPTGRTVFLYLVRGEMTVAGTPAKALHLLELNDDGDTVELEAQTACAILYGHAPPLHEPVVSYGPFVMNTEAEIHQAIRDYQAGKLGELVA